MTTPNNAGNREGTGRGYIDEGFVTSVVLAATVDTDDGFIVCSVCDGAFEVDPTRPTTTRFSLGDLYKAAIAHECSPERLSDGS